MILRTFTRGLLKPNRINIKARPKDYAVCIDIECTCDSPIQIHPMEVIELACHKINLDKIRNPLSRSEDEASRQTFHSFVKPVINPELTLFCQELTGISQKCVDESPPIERVMDNLFNWLKDMDLIDENQAPKKDFAFASCGNFDINLLNPILRETCHYGDKVDDVPIYFREWINVKKTFFNHKGEWPRGLYHMMELLDLEPSGRLHSAEDDCKNLARIVECLHQDGCKFTITSRTSTQSSNQSLPSFRTSR